ncbi:hypothetical protein HQ587_02725 [bacterium]|nr:hypothetical protein [bacterium]
MNMYGYGQGDKDKRTDPFRLFYRFLGGLFIVLGLMWLSVFKMEMYQSAKFALLTAGFCWSFVPRLRRSGIGWLIPFGRTWWEWTLFSIAFLLTVFGFSIPYISGMVFNHGMVWMIGSFTLIVGTSLLTWNLRKSEEESGDAGE